MRKEHDALGERDLPDEAWYGIQTLRAAENFAGLDRSFNDYPDIVRAMAEIKKACALSNQGIGALDDTRAQALCTACDEVIAGRFVGQFPVSVWRGGGTSLNMNLNEVIANRANELLTGHKGTDRVHPNTHANMGQSSNDVYPTAENIVLYRRLGDLISAMETFEATLEVKALAFKDVVRLGRTCLQDGIPMTLGQVFIGFWGAVRRNRMLLAAHRVSLCEGVLGGTVCGTGLGTLPGYRERIYADLSAVVGFEMRLAGGFHPVIEDAGLFDAMQNSDRLLVLAGYFKALACVIGRIANDLRLLSSGPRAGFAEIVLPAVAPGSSIMPGKINPFMCDLMVQVMHQVAGNDWAATLNTAANDLDLAFNGTVSFFGLLESCEMLEKGMALFGERCVAGITANEEVCRRYAEESTSLATLISMLFGYETGNRIAQRALREQITCKEAALRDGLITPEVADELFDVRNHAEHSRSVALLAKYGQLRSVL